jgi:starch synthase
VGQWGTRSRDDMPDTYLPKAGAAFEAATRAELQNDLQTSISVTRRQSILFVTSEIADYIKAGGLGEVSAA